MNLFEGVVEHAWWVALANGSMEWWNFWEGRLYMTPVDKKGVSGKRGDRGAPRQGQWASDGSGQFCGDPPKFYSVYVGDSEGGPRIVRAKKRTG